MRRSAPIARRRPILIAAFACALVGASPAVAIAPNPFLAKPQIAIARKGAAPSEHSTANPGDMVVLAASSPTATSFAWALAADSQREFFEDSSGGWIGFSSGTPGVYTFFCVGAVADSSGRPSLGIAKHVLTVGKPGPGPDPVPPPGPDPLPPGKYGLATFARDTAATVQSPSRNADAMAMANNFDSVASVIAAGALKTAQEIITATQAGNINALGANRQAWSSWGESLRQKLNALSDGKQLVSPEDYTTAWREISVGLRAVK